MHHLPEDCKASDLFVLHWPALYLAFEIALGRQGGDHTSGNVDDKERETIISVQW